MVAAIAWLSLAPSPLEMDLEGSDKLAHFASYAVVMSWFAQLYARRLYWAVGFIAMGIALELVQGWLGYRTLDLYDALANASGVLLGWCAALLVPRTLPGAGTGQP